MSQQPAADSPTTPGLTIIGTGAVAQTLGRLFARSGVLPPRSIVSRSKDRAEALAASLREPGGLPIAAYASLPQHLDQFVMIATPDRIIRATADALAKRQLIGPNSVVFHLSGALGSEVLEACAARGAATASVHPLASFADPADLAEKFQGVFCAVEGSVSALESIEPALSSIGARAVRLSGGMKIAYHAGAVLASGYMVATLGAALEALSLAGITDTHAREMLAPLTRISIENALRVGPREAMTGPLVRGDDAIVRAHLDLLERHDPALAECYRALTHFASDLLQRVDPLRELS
jgi:predicted short-subunit dehydrogenase-like oxidoreductase (DUF2520 family)